jgi:hypothetical protein
VGPVLGGWWGNGKGTLFIPAIAPGPTGCGKLKSRGGTYITRTMIYVMFSTRIYLEIVGGLLQEREL